MSLRSSVGLIIWILSILLLPGIESIHGVYIESRTQYLLSAGVQALPPLFRPPSARLALLEGIHMPLASDHTTAERPEYQSALPPITGHLSQTTAIQPSISDQRPWNRVAINRPASTPLNEV
jgi:hypothetical protein